MIAMIFVMIDKDTDRLLQIARQVVFFEGNAVFFDLVLAFDFTVRLRMEWSVANVFHLFLFHPFS